MSLYHFPLELYPKSNLSQNPVGFFLQNISGILALLESRVSQRVQALGVEVALEVALDTALRVTSGLERSGSVLERCASVFLADGDVSGREEREAPG